MNTKEISLRIVESYFKLFSEKRVKSRREFCEKLGIAPTNFCDVEHGRRKISLEHVCNFLTAYDVNPEWLFGGGIVEFHNNHGKFEM